MRGNSTEQVVAQQLTVFVNAPIVAEKAGALISAEKNSANQALIAVSADQRGTACGSTDWRRLPAPISAHRQPCRSALSQIQR